MMIRVQKQDELPVPIRFAWLELTAKCNLECVHCYADSGPSAGHGSIDVHRWKELIDELAAVGAHTVQFIGGEPTIFPGFSDLVKYAVSRKLFVEVYSNLTRLSEDMVNLFKSHGVSVATSYYSDDPLRHEQVTRVPRSHSRTLSNIRRLIGEGIPLRVGIVQVYEHQRTTEAARQLRNSGVSNINIDRLRGVGRGSYGRGACVDELCGACSGKNLAIACDGSVFPCIFARWLDAGSVSKSSLNQVLSAGRLRAIKDELAESFSKRVNASEGGRPGSDPEKPETCVPPCDPVEPHCGPCDPVEPDCGPCDPTYARAVFGSQR
jgi:sulfatase maturation enzyme AslB (radical SAM superfamily)